MDIKKIYTFFDRIQNSPEPVKQRWIAAVSVVAMVVIVFIWLKYFNTLFDPSGEEVSAPEVRQEGPSVVESIQNGFGVVREWIKGIFRGIGKALNPSRDVIIEP